MTHKPHPHPLLPACRPTTLVAAEETQDGLVVLLRPRFIAGPLARWLQPRLRRPHLRVKLDELGSFVWKRCDGRTTVGQIALALEEAFTASHQADKAMERIALFLRELERGGMIRLELPEE